MAETTARIVLSAEDKTQAALASLRNSLAGIETKAAALRGAFGALVPALSLGGAVAYFKAINDGVDALNDLKDATGASIENISALEDVAARTGTSLDVVGTSLVKFNQLLNASTPDSPQAKALKAIGLEAEQLKRLDPAEALRRTAVALAGFADDGNKARLAQELFGKSLKEVAPFLNDLATQTELVGKVTAEQADEAERFNKELFALQKNATDAGRALTADLVKGLNEAARAFREGGFLQGLQTLLTGNDEFKASKALVQDTEKLLNLENAIAQARASGASEDSRILKNLLEQKRATEENIRLTQNYLTVLRGDASLTGAPTREPERPAVEFNPEREKQAEERLKKWRAENEKARQQDLAGWVRYAEERVQADLDAARQIAEIQMKEADQAEAARREMLRQYFETIDQEQEEAIRQGQIAAGIGAENARQLKDTASDLSFAFSSAFEQAILDGRELSQVIQGIGRDIAQIALREAFTKPVGAAVAKAVGGFDFSSVFGFADGGIMTPNGPLPLRSYAMGGVADRPQLALFGEGSMNEAFVPLPDGRRIPVALQGGGGQQIVVNNSPVINIDARADRREVYELVDRAVRNGNAQLVDQLQRQGRI